MEGFVAAIASIGTFLAKSRLLYSLLLLLPVGILALILVVIFVRRGYERGFYRAGIAFGVTLLSASGAILLGKLLSLFTVAVLKKRLVHLIADVVSGIDPDVPVTEAENAHLIALTGGLLSALFSVLYFILLFILFLALLRTVFGSLAMNDKLTKEDAPFVFRLGGAGVAVLDALVIALLLFAPLYTLLGGVEKAVDDFLASNVVLYETYVSETESSGEEPDDSGLKNARIAYEAFRPAHDLVVSCPAVVLTKLPGLDFSRSIFGLYGYRWKICNVFDQVDNGVSVFMNAMYSLGVSPAEFTVTEISGLGKVVASSPDNSFASSTVSEVIVLAEKLSYAKLRKKYENETISAKKLYIAPDFGHIENAYGDTYFIINVRADSYTNTVEMFNNLRLLRWTMRLVIIDETTHIRYTVPVYAFDDPSHELYENYTQQIYLFRVAVCKYGIVPNRDHRYTVQIAVSDISGVLYAGESGEGAFVSSQGSFLKNGPIVYSPPLHSCIIDPFDKRENESDS